MRHFDLCVIGSGSGNSVIDDAMDDWSVAMVEAGTFGGTCLNVGCIPTKMYVYPADLAASPQQARELGVDLDLDRRPLARHPRPDLRPHRPDLLGRSRLAGQHGPT